MHTGSGMRMCKGELQPGMYEHPERLAKAKAAKG
jgi:hypothetical protein